MMTEAEARKTDSLLALKRLEVAMNLECRWLLEAGEIKEIQSPMVLVNFLLL